MSVGHPHMCLSRTQAPSERCVLSQAPVLLSHTAVHSRVGMQTKAHVLLVSARCITAIVVMLRSLAL
jgi:hypothetical protein